MFTITYRVPLAQIEVVEGAEEEDIFFLLYRVNRSVEGRCEGWNERKCLRYLRERSTTLTMCRGSGFV